MAKLLDKYEEKKNRLMDVFNHLKKSDFLPCYRYDGTKYDKKSVEEFAKNLEEEKFFISVCGQIKTGKSTLLNYLLFDSRNILSVDDLPCTAVITLIKHGDKESASAHFYTKDEWKGLRDECIEEIDEDGKVKNFSYFDRYMKEYVEECQKAGVYYNEVIGKPPKKIRDMNEFVEYTSAEGKYTPFVSKIEYLETPNNLIKDAIFVDTPGLNDPNKYRSRITTEWISKSNAAIYLMSANAVLESTDRDFIDEYLSSLIDKTLFVISRIDEQDDIKRQLMFAETKLRDTKEIKARHLLDKKKVFAISTVAASVNYKLKNKTLLDEEEQKLYDNKEKEELIDSKGNLDELVNAINDQLMTDKGAALIKTAANQIKDICETKIENLKDSISKKEEELFLLQQDKSTIEEKIRQYEELYNEFDRIDEEFGNKKDEIKNKMSIQFRKELGRFIEHIKNNVNDKINECKKKNELIEMAYYNYSEIVDKALTIFTDKFIGKEQQDEITEFINRFQRRLEDKTKHVYSFDIGYIFKPVIDIMDVEKAIKKIVVDLEKENIKEIKSSNIFKTPTTNLNITKEKLREPVSKVTLSIKNGLKEKIDGLLDKALADNYKLLKERVDSIIKDCKDSAEKILKKIDSKEARHKEVSKSIALEKEHLRKLQKDYEKIEREIL